LARRRRKVNVQPVFSAFLWGILISVGINPGQILFQVALEKFNPYLQSLSLIILVVTVYFSYDSWLEAAVRFRSAYRMVGILGVMGIILAFLSGFNFLDVHRAALILLLALLVWIYAQVA